MTENTGLEPRELPLGTPPPMITPPEGVVISRMEGDGWTRKYLYQSRRAMGGDIVENSLLIAEIPPLRAPVRREVPLQVTPAMVLPQNEPQVAAPPQTSSGPSPLPTSVPVPHYVPPPTPPVLQTPQLGKPMSLPGSLGAGRVPGRGASSAFSGVPAAQASLPPQEVQRMALSGPTETVISAPRQLRLSQATPPPSSVPAPPCPVPPGPLQLPDGKIIQLDDPITLGELWEILPYLAQQCSPPPAQTPQQQPTGIPTSPVGAGFPGFGPASGAFGQGGFIGQGGGGNLFGPLGQVSTPIPQPGGGGSVGPQGPPGPPGAGAVIDFVVKDDGDFTTGSGSPVPVPGTLLSFVQGVSGNALFIINANTSLNGGLPVQNILGIQIDGGVVTILQQTNVPPIDKNPISPNWAQFLVAGPHTVQVVYTGFAVFRLNANPSQPLVLSVVHS